MLYLFFLERIVRASETGQDGKGLLRSYPWGPNDLARLWERLDWMLNKRIKKFAQNYISEASTFIRQAKNIH